jgi:hypothetical protein
MSSRGKIREGQVWMDNDKRIIGRNICIWLVDRWNRYAYAYNTLTHRKCRILVSRFKPTSTGYRYLYNKFDRTDSAEKT